MNKKKNVIYDKSFDFSVKIVKLCRFLFDEKKEYILGKQLLKSGTSIGANVSEAIEGQSKRDFIAKLSISLKEASETRYWLNLLVATDILKKDNIRSLIDDVREIIKILNSILRTARNNLKS